MYWVYIIKSQKDGKFYTGMTKDVERRLEEHNVGKKSTPSTINRGPFVLVYKESFLTRIESRNREKWLKSGQGRLWRNNNIRE